MARYAHILDGLVSEIIDLPAGFSPSDIYPPEISIVAPDGQLTTQPMLIVPCADTSVVARWHYDGETFSAPSPLPSTPPRRQFSFNEFLDLLVMPSEQLAIADAARTDAVVNLWLAKATGASFIDLDNPKTADGLGILVSKSLLTTDRKSAILAGTPV